MVKKKKKLLEKVSSKQKPKENKRMSALFKELDKAFLAIRFYPVASDEKSKEEAKKKILSQYKKGDDTTKQLILYMFHENLANTVGMRIMQNFEFFKRKFPNLEPQKVRVQVYRSMFNYTNSLEGTIELVKMLGKMDGDDASKLLSYHLSFAMTAEFEINHILRNVIIEALGDSESVYALNVLLNYAKYTGKERALNRIGGALSNWSKKIDGLKILVSEKEKIKKNLDDILTSEFMGSHYG